MRLSWTNVAVMAILGFPAIIAIPRLTTTITPPEFILYAPDSHTTPYNTHPTDYLQLTLPAPPFLDLFHVLHDYLLPSVIKTRGEAHITVLTPPEFESIKDVVSIQELHDLMQQLHIQEQTNYTMVCLGKSTAKQIGDTYYVVVDAPYLTLARQEIKKKVEERGGQGAWETYHPHITIGFTKRDLFAQDGVVKDETSCWADLIHPDQDIAQDEDNTSEDEINAQA